MSKDLAERMEDFYQGVPIDDEEVTVGAASVGLDPPQRARSAVVQAQENPVRFRLIGSPPEAGLGHRLAANEWTTLTGWETIVGALFIREGGADGVLAVTYFD